MSAVAHLTPQTIGMLLIPPFFWAGNVVLGRLIQDLCPPVTLNFLRWVVAFLLVLPLAWRVLLPGGPIWGHWKRYALIGFLGVGSYNSFQYLALQTSSPINITLVASSTPVFMLGLGALFFGQSVRKRQWLGALMSIIGVLTVLSRGDWHNLLHVRWVLGDLFILLATAEWAWYSWLLSQPQDPPALRADWAGFLIAQLAFGLLWSGLFGYLMICAFVPFFMTRQSSFTKCTRSSGLRCSTRWEQCTSSTVSSPQGHLSLPRSQTTSTPGKLRQSTPM